MLNKILILFFLLGNYALAAERLEGKVVGVHDGDTLTLLVAGNKTLRVRMAQIDAPESQQAFGQKSKQSLSDMAFNKYALVDKEAVDRYGRIVGTVFVDDLNVNRKQVEQGMAWAYRQYVHDNTLLQLEANAKQAGIGLWADPNPVPPWEYRHGGKVKPVAAEQSAGSSCGSKRYCKQMDSCEEAKQYLACGVSSLDGDGDGVPCEKLCAN